MNQLLRKHSQEVEKILANYPPDQKRAVVMPLLHLVQQEDGFISRERMHEIAEIAGVTATEVASIVGFYTLFHDAPGARIKIQVCTDVACDLRGARKYLDGLCSQLGIKPGETTEDGLVSIEEVKCLAACDHAPMFQAQIGDALEYHENQTVERTMDWLKSMIASMKSPALPNEKKMTDDGGSHE